MAHVPRPSASSLLLAAALVVGGALVLAALGGSGGGATRPFAHRATPAERLARAAVALRPWFQRDTAATGAATQTLPSAAATDDRTVVTGIVLDLDGAPRPTARVELRSRDGATSGTTVTDDDGRFAIPLELPLGGSFDGHVVARQAELVGSAPLFVRADLAPDDLELALVRELALVGRVDTAGLPVEDVELVAERIGAVVRGTAPATRVRTGRDGSFRMPVYGAGVYQLVARRGALRVEVAHALQVLDGATPAPIVVELPAVDEVALIARRRDGAPLGGVAVKEAYSGEVVGVTDAGGVARFLAPRFGSTFVLLGRDGYPTIGHDLAPGGGEVMMPTAEELADLAVAATDEDSTTSEDGVDDASGEGEGEGDDGEREIGDEVDATYTLSINYLWGDDGLVVLGPYVDDEGAAVATGGLLPGDLILAVDGVRATQGVIGALGKVRLRVRRPATGKEFEVTLARDVPYEELGC